MKEENQILSENNLNQQEPESGKKKKNLRRDPKNKIFGGVISGLSEYINVDATILRILFILFFLFGEWFFLFISIYIIAWVIIPEKKENQISQLTENEEKKQTSDNSIFSSILKFGCLGIGGIIAFFGLIFFLLLLLPVFFIPDILQSFFYPDFGSENSYNLSFFYNLNIIQLVIGAIFVIILPIIYFFIRVKQKTKEEDNKTTFWIILLLWLAGIFMVISSLNKFNKDFEPINTEYSFLSIKFEQIKNKTI